MLEYLDADHWRVAQLVDELQATAHEKRELQFIEMLKPTLSKDGNQFCFLYGELPNNCVVGYGDTVAKAMYDFAHNFRTATAVNQHPCRNNLKI